MSSVIDHEVSSLVEDGMPMLAVEEIATKFFDATITYQADDTVTLVTESFGLISRANFVVSHALGGLATTLVFNGSVNTIIAADAQTAYTNSFDSFHGSVDAFVQDMLYPAICAPLKKEVVYKVAKALGKTWGELVHIAGHDQYISLRLGEDTCLDMTLTPSPNAKAMRVDLQVKDTLLSKPVPGPQNQSMLAIAKYDQHFIDRVAEAILDFYELPTERGPSPEDFE